MKQFIAVAVITVFLIIGCTEKPTQPASTAPIIITQPQSQIVSAGQNATLSVVATGTGQLSYQWYKNDTAISGADTSSYTLSNVQLSSTGTYSVSISNGTLPDAISNGVTLTLNSPWEPPGRSDLTFSGGMVLIKAAGHSFLMGSDSTGDYTASMAHTVIFTKDYYMDTVDVTQGQYLAVTGTNPAYFNGDLNRPMESISWYDAVKFCNQRSILEGLTPCYDTTTWNCTFTNNGYRLPTEAEWEYGCRAGTTTAYFWGVLYDSATVSQYAWYYQNSGGTTQPVGKKLPNAYGLYDMIGNVFQWCYDWYDAYALHTQTDPIGPATSVIDCKVLRGSSWATSNDYVLHSIYILRSVERAGAAPNSRWVNFIGFRCVRQ